MNKFLCRPLNIGLLTALLIGLDQITKYLAVRCLKGQAPLVIWKGVFELQYLENQGAAFGMLQGQRTFFLLGGLAVLAGAFYLFKYMSKDARFWPVRLLAVAVLAGAWGNMIDRLRLSYVVDFFYFKLIDFPIFNVADIYVSVAVAVFAVLLFFVYSDEELEGLFPGRNKKKENPS